MTHSELVKIARSKTAKWARELRALKLSSLTPRERAKLLRSYVHRDLQRQMLLVENMEEHS